MGGKLALCIDLDRCWGCRTCEVACALEKGAGPGRGRIRVVEIAGQADPGDTTPAQMPAPTPSCTQAATPSLLQPPVPARHFVPVTCQHCDDPACAAACPSGALSKTATGLVTLDSDLCTACGTCESACPYGAIFLSPETGQPEKCDLCASRQTAGLIPACARHCPGRAFGTLESEPIVTATDPMEDPAAAAAAAVAGAAAAGADVSAIATAHMCRGLKKTWSVGKVVFIFRDSQPV